MSTLPLDNDNNNSSAAQKQPDNKTIMKVSDNKKSVQNMEASGAATSSVEDNEEYEFDNDTEDEENKGAKANETLEDNHGQQVAAPASQPENVKVLAPNKVQSSQSQKPSTSSTDKLSSNGMLPNPGSL